MRLNKLFDCGALRSGKRRHAALAALTPNGLDRLTHISRITALLRGIHLLANGFSNALGDRAEFRLLFGGQPQVTRQFQRYSAFVQRIYVLERARNRLFLAGCQHRFDAPYRRLLRSLMGHAAVLQRGLAGTLDGTDRLWAALALVEVSLCVDKVAPSRRAASAFLIELDRQILGDGGHISRNPQVIVDLLLDVLPLRQAFAARGAEVPPPLLNAIDRMMPMLRMFRHADGALALFNGMGTTQPEQLATILIYDDARATPLINAPYSGYQRLAGGDAVVIYDTGVPPPAAFASRANAGTLAFELSFGSTPLVVNCGHPGPGDRAMTAAARSTAAHSTLVMADTSSSRLMPPLRRTGQERLLLPGPLAVPVTRQAAGETTLVEASHDGYAGLGFSHRRRVVLAVDGLSLVGEDDLLPVPEGRAPVERAFAIRFHLHPLTRASYASDGRSIVIALPRGGAWRFETDGPEVAIEESIALAGVEGPRRAEQIVVLATTADTRRLRWSFTAIEGP